MSCLHLGAPGQGSTNQGHLKSSISTQHPPVWAGELAPVCCTNMGGATQHPQPRQQNACRQLCRSQHKRCCGPGDSWQQADIRLPLLFEDLHPNQLSPPCKTPSTTDPSHLTSVRAPEEVQQCQMLSAPWGTFHFITVFQTLKVHC